MRVKPFVKILLYAVLGITVLSAQEHPSSVVKAYYQAQSQGNIVKLKQIMTPFSFDTDMQVFALSIALKNPKFHAVLKQYGTSPKVNQAVQKAVSIKLQKRAKRKLSHFEEIPIGKERVMVRYLEAKHKKQLYLSMQDHHWKIDYLAGRKTE